MIRVTLSRPWLIADLAQEMRVLSWAPHRPGLVLARQVIWREVRDADLPEGLDAAAWLASEVTAIDRPDAVAMLTSRNVGKHSLTQAESGDTKASCLATVGLSNAERVGHRQPVLAESHGTVNLLVTLSQGLGTAAMTEAMSIAAEARTAAIIAHGPELPEGPATGTGTDCIALACPFGDRAYAGLHTEIGEVIGRAVYDAVARGTRDWMTTEAPR
ncbi:adenosylcobinamide amidohydrolase [Rhodophyticola porphyridii]|uniref:Adenosylcobinamide amidohydrolase n=1 Tax=Rhodophyticola porphyridii TaxID=1852017 RepID=A0A3L9Y701_9RHOB|nr:adenosylcobinamide amidohydrolase [Rhodophyticola porphyridii]RMA42857.1 adenosylcobinamide amidohydrolase [Rhodophyticola porphyridii]